MERPGDPQRYVVIEGNRRIVTLKVLENPDLIAGSAPKSIVTAMRSLNKEYQTNPITSVQCVVVNNREEGRHWIELRHTGENEGAGIVPWGADETARFRARTSGFEPHQQALNYLENKGYLAQELRAKVPSTSFRRLVGSPEVRVKLGLEVQDGHLCMLADEKDVAQALMYVVNDLATGQTKVKDIYTKAQRLAYATSLPANIAVTPTMQSGQGVDISTGNATKTKRAPAPRVPRLRDCLIPRDCTLNITELRIQHIESELRRLKIESFPNSVSVLFRVFVELSADAYIDRLKLSLPAKPVLRTKLDTIVSDLTTRQKMTKQQATPVRRALQKDSFLAPSMNYDAPICAQSIRLSFTGRSTDFLG